MLANERGDTSVLTSLFGHNAWANLKLLDFCEGLSDEQLQLAIAARADTIVHAGAGCQDYAPPCHPERSEGSQMLPLSLRWTSGTIIPDIEQHP